MKKMIIAGGSGFLGKELENHFRATGYEVILLTRTPSKAHHLFWDGKNLSTWASSLEGAQVLINLAGKSVDCRYTKKNRQDILRSRLHTTNVLQQAINQLANPPKVWINTSSATIYVHSEKERMTETDGIIGDDFSMRVCKAWEHAFFKDNQPHVRKIALRTSIVLGNSGGAFPKYKTITKLGLGGHQGRGNQWMSWIHIHDFCRAVEFIVNDPTLSGPINVTTPKPVRNSKFMALLRKKYKRPGITITRWVLELGAAIMGTETELLLKSRYVFPDRLLKTGFIFKYPSMETALEHL